jgi:predicted flap endonuclease-1-like 5' DNA nuclease
MKKKVKFVLSADIVAGAEDGLLIGEFNNWTLEEGFSLKKTKSGGLETTVSLEAGRSYQYRYLLSDGRWVNDNNAIQYVHDAHFQIDNCLISVPAEEESVSEKKAPAKKAPAKKAASKEPSGADDLTLIEGVGKKIAEILTANGIASFEDLSKSKVTSLRAILEAAGSRYKVHEPGTWPKQAKLAATGKWEELKKLQAELKGGK